MQPLCQPQSPHPGCALRDEFLARPTRHFQVSYKCRVVATRGQCSYYQRELFRGDRIVVARHPPKTTRRAMNILIWLIMGGIIGWLASVIMRTQEGILLNIVVGIVGALIGGWALSPMGGA